MASTVKTRVLIISDTHCASLSGDDHDATSPFTSPLPTCDLLIHCGDLTHEGTIEQYHYTLDMLKEIDAPVKLVIAGNHDLSLDRDYVFSHMRSRNQTQAEADREVKQARQLWTDPEGRAKQEGVTFLDEGVHQIRLENGATVRVYASPYTPEFCGWGFPYQKYQDRFNLPGTSLSDANNITVNPIPALSSSSQQKPPVDILITHGPPYAHMDMTANNQLAGCPHLLLAAMRSRPLVHCFGHIHEGWGAERITWSPHADTIAANPHSTVAWKAGAWEPGVQDTTATTPDLTSAEHDHAVYVDVSDTSAKALKRGEETLMVNAAIMDVKYRPANAPFVVDLDLPKA